VNAADVLMIVGGLLGVALGSYLVARFATLRRIDQFIGRAFRLFLLLVLIVAATAGVIGMVLAAR